MMMMMLVKQKKTLFVCLQHACMIFLLFSKAFPLVVTTLFELACTHVKGACAERMGWSVGEVSSPKETATHARSSDHPYSTLDRVPVPVQAHWG